MLNSKLNYSNSDLVNLVLTIAKKSKKGAALITKQAIIQKLRRPYLTNLLISPTLKCNLSCIHCYSSSSAVKNGDLSNKTIDTLIEEGTKLGVFYYTLSGGEPIHKSIEIAEKHPRKLFIVYTNGVQIDKSIAKKISKLGNLAPIISIEGEKYNTDRVRGDGVYDKIMKAIENLKINDVVFGWSFKLSSNNSYVYNNDEFINYLKLSGATFGRFHTNLPYGRGASFNSVPSLIDREKQGKALQILKIIKPNFFTMDYLNNPDDIVQGCGGAGLRYVHVSSNGESNKAYIYPCPFIGMPEIFNLDDAYNNFYSKKNLSINNLMDIIKKGPLLNRIRQIALMRPNNSCCLILNNPDKLLNIYENLYNNYPTKQFGGFFHSKVGGEILENYRLKLKQEITNLEKVIETSNGTDYFS